MQKICKVAHAYSIKALHLSCLKPFLIKNKNSENPCVARLSSVLFFSKMPFFLFAYYLYIYLYIYIHVQKSFFYTCRKNVSSERTPYMLLNIIPKAFIFNPHFSRLYFYHLFISSSLCMYYYIYIYIYPRFCFPLFFSFTFLSSLLF